MIFGIYVLAVYDTFRNNRQVSLLEGVYRFVEVDTPELLGFFVSSFIWSGELI